MNVVVARISLDRMVRQLIAFVPVVLACVMVITYFPALSLTLRDMAYAKQGIGSLHRIGSADPVPRAHPHELASYNAGVRREFPRGTAEGAGPTRTLRQKD